MTAPDKYPDLVRALGERRRAMKAARKIPRLLFGPLLAEAAYDAAVQHYKWFRRGENRFQARGLHGHSGSLFFSAFDEGLATLPRDRFISAFLDDAAAHTKRRFAGQRKRLKVAGRHGRSPSEGC